MRYNVGLQLLGWTVAFMEQVALEHQTAWGKATTSVGAYGRETVTQRPTRSRESIAVLSHNDRPPSDGFRPERKGAAA